MPHDDATRPPQGQSASTPSGADAGAAGLNPRLRVALDELFGLSDRDDSWVALARRAGASSGAGGKGPPLGSLGPYELLEEIGRSPHGEVYRARHRGTGQLLALKRVRGVRPESGATAGISGRAARLAASAVLARSPKHPHIAAVFEAGMLDGHSVLVRELVDGTPIDRWSDQVRNGIGTAHAAGEPDPGATLLDAIGQMVAAVGFAHGRGVLHGGLSAGNVLVDLRGRVKVLDFGASGGAADDRGARGPDAPNAPQGSAAPAAAQSHEPSAPADARGDVAALAGLVYRVLTGRSLTPGHRSPMSTPRLDAPHGVPRDLAWVIARAADPDSSKRYATVEALAEDIRRARRGRPVVARPSTWRYRLARAPRGVQAAIAAGLALLVVLVAGVAVGFESARRAEAGRRDAERSLDSAISARDLAARGIRDESARRDTADRDLAVQIAVADLLAGTLMGTDPAGVDKGATLDQSVVEAIKHAAARLDVQPAPAPVEAQVRHAFGHAMLVRAGGGGQPVQSRSADYAAAAVQLSKATTLREQVFGPGSDELRGTLVLLGRAQQGAGEYAAAAATRRRAAQLARDRLGADSDAFGRSQVELSESLASVGEFTPAALAAGTAAEVFLKRSGPHSRATAEARIANARALSLAGDHAAAAPMARSAMIDLEQAADATPAQRARAALAAAEILTRAGDGQGAARLRAQADATK